MSTIVILGFSSTDKIPRFAGETKYKQSALSAGAIPLTLLLIGLKSSAGTMTADTDVLDVYSADDVATYAGAGSELHRMSLKAFAVPGVRVKIACPAAAGGAVAGAATITIAGTWTTGGQYSYRIAGELVSGGIAATDLLGDVAASIAANIQSKSYLPCTAIALLGVVTLTHKCPGARGNQTLLFQDVSQLPTGATSAVAGGSAITGGGVPFTSGSGSEDVSNLKTTLFPGLYHRMALAQNDVTNAAKWKSQMTAKAGPLEGRMEHALCASTAALATAQTLSKTTLNEPRCQCLWQLNGETPPAEIAASMAAYRVQAEQDQPNSSYDGVVLLSVAPQSQRADWPNNATLQAALESGLTPLQTTEDDLASAKVVRAITTSCLNGADPDFRCFDVADAVVPDYARTAARLKWGTDFVVNNPYVRDNPGPGEKDPPAGVATPLAWTHELVELGNDMVAAKILERCNTASDDTPYSEYDKTAKRIMSAWPLVRLAHQHQIGVSVRQMG